MIALLILVFAIIALMQIPSLIRKQWWRELIVFIILWLLGLVLSVLISLGIKIQVTSIIWRVLAKLLGVK
jgi:hypothetical protein